MQLKLVRRWGSHPAGETVEVDDTQGRWLLDTAFAVRPGDEDRNRANYRAEGEHGPDPRAGGDPTRLRMAAATKGPREGNRAGRVAGAPARVGDVTHVADENLGKVNREHRGDVPLASGKRLTEELAEVQKEHDRRDAERDEKRKAAQTPGEPAEGTDAAAKNAPPASGGSPQPEGRLLTQPKR